VGRLEEAGFGFGKQGAKPGQFYEFDHVKTHTPNPHGINTTTPVA